MNELKANLYDCKHCSGTGTCKNGADETSCLSCAKKAELRFWNLKNQKGLVCGSCGGIGQAEPLTEKMNKRVAPLLAIYLVLILLGLIFYTIATKSPYFNEILAFSSAVIGSVVGYYFSNRKGG